jgi:allantoin racemase
VRLLVANPNTTAAVTERIAAAARTVAAPGTEIVTATGAFGGEIIGTRTEMAVAEHAAASLLAAHAEGCNGAIVGASLDSGVRAGREMLGVPVLGITEAALHAACLLGGRFGVLTLSAQAAVITREMVGAYGLADRLAGMRFADSSPQGLMAGPAALVPELAALAALLVREDLADVVVLVGAVMAGMPALLQPEVEVPVIEGVTCAVGLLEGLVRLRPAPARAGSYAGRTGRRTLGLDPALAARIG